MRTKKWVLTAGLAVMLAGCTADNETQTAAISEEAENSTAETEPTEPAEPAVNLIDDLDGHWLGATESDALKFELKDETVGEMTRQTAGNKKIYTFKAEQQPDGKINLLIINELTGSEEVTEPYTIQLKFDGPDSLTMTEDGKERKYARSSGETGDKTATEATPEETPSEKETVSEGDKESIAAPAEEPEQPVSNAYQFDIGGQKYILPMPENWKGKLHHDIITELDQPAVQFRYQNGDSVYEDILFKLIAVEGDPTAFEEATADHPFARPQWAAEVGKVNFYYLYNFGDPSAQLLENQKHLEEMQRMMQEVPDVVSGLELQ